MKRKSIALSDISTRSFIGKAAVLVTMILGLSLSGCSRAAVKAKREVISLAGVWRFRLDPGQVGQKQKWHEDRLPETISLPGSTTENGYGDDISVDTRWTGDIVDKSWFIADKYAPYRQQGNIKIPFWLQPAKHYVGPAWYQKDIMVPKSWRDKRVLLHWERCHGETRLWVDGWLVGGQNSLSTPHEYDLGQLTPGKHRLTICVDNTVKINVGVNAHSVSDHTQSNWNGIIGDIHLRAGDSTWIDDVQVYPDIKNKIAKVRVIIKNVAAVPAEGVIKIEAKSFNSKHVHKIEPISERFSAGEPEQSIEMEYPMGENFLLWDEFSPNLYCLVVTIQGGNIFDNKTVQFGMRNFGTQGTQFTINGRKTMLRGTLECCIFPKTGYPPTDIEEWMRIIKAAKSHGLNHFRFHSHCPPKAAFEAADRLGFYFQVEGPFWTTVGNGEPVDEYIYAECDRILTEYGNHPSFCLMAYGNEPGGNNQQRFLGDLIEYWKKKDPRHLYTSAAGWPVIPQNQYHSMYGPRIQPWGAGLNSRINAHPPETMTDYRDHVLKYKVPIVSHEIGQWCVYPNLKEIDKYTGVLKAKNFEIFRDTLKENHMLDQAQDFLMASGKLQTLCYKEEIESALRTPGFGGFQLLDLHDFPGQGTALVGVLDPFWESKGYVSAEGYSRFCNQTVPLARMKKRIWTADETFEAEIEVSHFGPAPLENARPSWTITDERGNKIASGNLASRTIPIGNGTSLGKINMPLSRLNKAAKLVLEVFLTGTSYANDWDFWVYPETIDTQSPDNFLITACLDDEVLSLLGKGGKVLLIPPKGTVKGDKNGKIPPGFSSIFWNTSWTKRQPPHTLGILCEPEHPAWADFPTEYHSNWQWWQLITNSQIMILNEFPAKLRPIVQVVDDWVTNRRLGLVFEAKVNGGKLLVCSIDLRNNLEDRPVARQLRYSLIKYMNSDRFRPRHTLSVDTISELFISSLQMEVVMVDSEAQGYEGFNAVDGDPDTIWHTPWDDGAPGYPHEIQIKLKEATNIQGLTYLPRQDIPNGWISEYEVYVSDDGKSGPKPVAQGTFAQGAEEKKIIFTHPLKCRYIRFVALKGIEGQKFASVAELKVIKVSER